jgi:hypothetical protein
VAWPEVHIDWDGEGFDTTESATPIYDRGLPVTVAYGRDVGRAFAPLAPGRAGFEINNPSTDYHPENEASPLYGLLHSGSPVRVTVPYPETGTPVVVYRGYLDDYLVDPEWTRKGVQVTCTDALARLRGTILSTPLHQGLRTGEAIGLLLDAAGWPEDARDLDRGASVLPWWWAEGVNAGDELLRLLDTEGPGSLLTVDSDGRLVFRDRHHRLTRTESTTVQATFTGGGTEPVASPPMRYDQGWKDIVNAVTLQVEVRAPASVAQVVGSAPGTWHIPDATTVDLTIRASDPFIEAITPEEGVDYTLVSGTVEVTLSRDNGQSTTVHVTASGGPAVVSDVQVRGYPVTGATMHVTAEDTGSISRHGRRTWPDGRAPVYASLWDHQAIALIILGHRSERLPAISFTVHGAAGPERAAQQLDRDLSDRIHVTAAGVDADMWIERIEHTFGAVVRDTVFACEKVPAQPEDTLILGDGELGTGTLGRVGLDNPAQMFLLDSASQGVLGSVLLAH